MKNDICAVLTTISGYDTRENKLTIEHELAVVHGEDTGREEMFRQLSKWMCQKGTHDITKVSEDRFEIETPSGASIRIELFH